MKCIICSCKSDNAFCSMECFKKGTEILGKAGHNANEISLFISMLDVITKAIGDPK